MRSLKDMSPFERYKKLTLNLDALLDRPDASEEAKAGLRADLDRAWKHLSNQQKTKIHEFVRELDEKAEAAKE